jgi:hypothetical protein
MHVRLMVLAIAATIPAASFAAPASERSTAADPNEKVCENLSQIGSRLTKKRVCATRAEWADRRLQDRKDGEAIQRQMNGSTCTSVKTNGMAVC